MSVATKELVRANIAPELVPDSTLNIYARKVALMQDLGNVGKSGKNPHLKNEYIRYQDLMDALRPLCAAYGIDVTCEIAEGPIGLVTLTNVDDPKDQIVQRWAPTDLPKDQGGSYLIKYALMKLFLIGDGEDPDKDLGAPPATPKVQPATPPVKPMQPQTAAAGSGSTESTPQQLLIRALRDVYEQIEDRKAFCERNGTEYRQSVLLDLTPVKATELLNLVGK